jgi:hypothetical protein
VQSSLRDISATTSLGHLFGRADLIPSSLLSYRTQRRFGRQGTALRAMREGLPQLATASNRTCNVSNWRLIGREPDSLAWQLNNTALSRLLQILGQDAEFA